MNELQDWRVSVAEEIDKWKKDPNYIPILPALRNPTEYSRWDLQDQRLEQLEQRIAHLEACSDTNAKVFSDAIQLLEVYSHALQLGFDDLMTNINQVKTTQVDGVTKVDFPAYIRMANAHREKVIAQDAEDGKEPIQEDPHFEFGG
jgi:hypothetical protein